MGTVTAGGESRWFDVLTEVRRQAKHIADLTGIESTVASHGRFLDRAEETWQVLQRADSGAGTFCGLRQLICQLHMPAEYGLSRLAGRADLR